MAEEKNKKIKIEDLENVSGGLVTAKKCPICGTVVADDEIGCGKCNPNQYSCKTCGETFAWRFQLEDHNWREHAPSGGPFFPIG